MRARAPYLLALLVLGVGWGSTQSLGEIATSTGHGHPEFDLLHRSDVCGAFPGCAAAEGRNRLTPPSDPAAAV